MRKIKRYVVDDFDSEVYACSLVDAPAIESGYVSFAAQMPKVVMLESDEKRMVAGPVLIPDKEIYRYDEYTGEEFYIVFTAKAIERLAGKYLREWKTTNWTVDHERYANGVYTMESWIKTDMEKDKSVALGLDPNLPQGTWFMTARIDSDEIWNEVKNGRWTGFSVEAWISLKEENFNKNKKKNEQMNENTLFERIEELFKSYFSKHEPEAQAEPAAEEKVKMEEQPSASVEAEEQAQRDGAVELEEETPATAEETQEDYKAEVENLRKAVEDLTAKLGEANSQIAELSKQPSAEPVNVKASAETKGDVMDTIRALREGTYFKA